MSNEDVIKDLEASIEFLEKGQSRKEGEFVVGRFKNGRIQVNGYLPYDTIDQIPKETVKEELQLLKDKFVYYMNQSPIFEKYVLNIGIDYYVCLDDKHNAGIAICAEIDDVYKEI